MEPTIFQVLLQITPIIAVLISFTVMMWNKHNHLAKERLSAVISPLFEILEPYMGTNPPENTLDTAEQVFEIIRKNTFLSGGKLREYLFLNHHEKIDSAKLVSLCYKVDREYDRLCKSLDVPLRSEQYRKDKYRSEFGAFYPGNTDKWFRKAFMVFSWITILQIVLRTLTPYGPNSPHEYFMVDHTVMFFTSVITATLAIIVKIQANTRADV